MLNEWLEYVRGYRSQLGGAPVGQIWEILNLKKKKAQKGYNPLHQVRLHEAMFKEINKKRKFYLIVEGQAIKVEKMRM